MVQTGSAQASDWAVEATGLTKVFRDFWGRPKAKAVNGVDLRIRRGQVFGLLGPNGSGKSTTVKMLLGLLYPTRGSLTVLGQSPRNVEAKRRIGYLPEETYLYRYLTAAETLDFFGALFGLTAEERQRRTRQLLTMVGLETARNRPVGEFSKGMARRIGLAQALINDPDLVILDEPTSGLDPIGCREVKDLIQLLASRGKTIILCSHLLADVEDVCDEVVVFYGGRVRAQGRLGDLLAIQDRTRIETPRLDPAVLARVLDLLNQTVGADQVSVAQPSMDLEDFFLDVVRQAREASVDTAGARAGGPVADYLRTGTPAAGATVLDLLAAPEPAAAAAAPEPPPAAPAHPEALASIADTPAPSKPEAGATTTPQAAAAQQAANDRLKSLLE
ncbi:MAG: ABC transporter ATP-binding protein [Lentisphaeria bacterium]